MAYAPELPLLEREAPLEALRTAADSAAAGQGRLVLVAGEAGVGKTALVRAFCDERRSDALVLSGACDALFTPRPMGPFLEIAEDLSERVAEARRLGLLEVGHRADPT